MLLGGHVHIEYEGTSEDHPPLLKTGSIQVSRKEVGSKTRSRLLYTHPEGRSGVVGFGTVEHFVISM